ncbi:polysaccharide deacetylase family protein [Streptomyces sp. KLOTTS4A1]|uniref:polysaccharide deacetylase family protein n=1 Tax=Streptomyces sp. KLOTTS4A1 TaxID=3390996 RepID=UPI0039F61375
MSRIRTAALAAFAALSIPLAASVPAHAEPSDSWAEPAPVISQVDTDEPVAFITIDDGWGHDPSVQRMLLDRHVPASLFINPVNYSWDRDYFQQLLNHGPSRMENHAVDHLDLTELDFAAQKEQICGARDAQLAAFGDSPRLFRPPAGAYNEDTRIAAAECGAAAVVTWTHDLTDWPWIPGEPEIPELNAGDILLVHLGPDTAAADLERVLDAVDAAGLRPAPLRDHLPG